MASKNFTVKNGLQVGNTTIYDTGAQISSESGTANINFVSSNANGTYITLANSIGAAGITPNTIYSGNSTTNAVLSSVGFSVGNSTSNTTANSSVIKIGNSSVFVNINSFAISVGAFVANSQYAYSGTNTSPLPGLAGFSNSSTGVSGYSNTSFGVYGETTSGTAVRAFSITGFGVY